MAARSTMPPENILQTPTVISKANSNTTVEIDKNKIKDSKVEEIATCLENRFNHNSQQNSRCNCTNISRMRLFYEMKQKFPGAADPIVIQCVNNNCHNRDNCMQNLRKQLDINPTLSQTYPLKILRSQQISQNKKMEKQRSIHNKELLMSYRCGYILKNAGKDKTHNLVPNSYSIPISSSILHDVTFQSDPLCQKDFRSPVGEKSFTTINQTKKQPNVNIPSTLYVSVAPGLQLNYSSSSYDAREEYKKNINVFEDEGILCIRRTRPGICYLLAPHQPEKELKAANLVESGVSFQKVLQAFSLTSPTQIVSTTNQYKNGYLHMLHQQKHRTTNILTVLRDKKKRLEQVQEEIRVLTQHVIRYQSKMLDYELWALRSNCLVIINKIENSETGVNRNFKHGPQDVFPNQSYIPTFRPTQDSLCKSKSSLSAHPKISCQKKNIEEFPDSKREKTRHTWICNMCTFRNHHLLNNCECCENVRIIPGTIRILPAMKSVKTSSLFISNEPLQSQYILSQPKISLNSSNVKDEEGEPNYTQPCVLHP